MGSEINKAHEASLAPVANLYIQALCLMYWPDKGIRGHVEAIETHYIIIKSD